MSSENEISGNVPTVVDNSNNTYSQDTPSKDSANDQTIVPNGNDVDVVSSDLTSDKLPTNSPDSQLQPPTTPQTPSRPKRLIGSQRNPEAYKSQQTIKVVDTTSAVAASTPDDQNKQQPQNLSPNNNTDNSLQKKDNNQTNTFDKNSIDDDDDIAPESVDLDKKILSELMVSADRRIEIPKLRGGKMSDDLEAEFQAVMGVGSIDNMIQNASEIADKEVIESGTKMKAKVLAIRGDSVFIDLNVREQGVVLLNMFNAETTPKVGDEIDITVGKLDLDEGLYDVTVPLAAADVKDWAQVHEGMIVEAKVTKSNNGGLECEVNHLRGFIPISHIDIFRVDNLEQYVGQKLTCIVEEVDPERRNLVVSRRAMINREREEQKKSLLAELAIGQVREGLVRKIIDGGVFVDLGGVDGFVPIGKLSWGRVRHPSDVVSEGKRVVVRIDKIEEGTNRISLTYRDDSSNPWSNIFEHFQEKTQARGKVVKITAFGAFVELMPGVDGLVLISELSNKHVKSVHEVLKEGEWVDVFIVSIDTEAKRIKLSIRQLTPVEPEVSEVDATESADDTTNAKTDPKSKNNKKKQEGVAAAIKIKNVHKGPLKGGIGNNSGGSNVGLNW
ncbi:MAG: S1 RNA-binding domain-containing protein [Planctomycetaceae bacterium]|jgi:small subunit ribosomal protein S1|nr:S1 RNA-binding domain-containing protein [Planctomycetaceae bacterium]